MDSLSQIVLGAAVGEATLGRRIGNRAMIWGAVAGTIPDMDVLGKYYLSELDNLAFHRGISHSMPVIPLRSPAISTFGCIRSNGPSKKFRATMSTVDCRQL